MLDKIKEEWLLLPLHRDVMPAKREHGIYMVVDWAWSHCGVRFDQEGLALPLSAR